MNLSDSINERMVHVTAVHMGLDYLSICLPGVLAILALFAFKAPFFPYWQDIKRYLPATSAGSNLGTTSGFLAPLSADLWSSAVSVDDRSSHPLALVRWPVFASDSPLHSGNVCGM